MIPILHTSVPRSRNSICAAKRPSPTPWSSRGVLPGQPHRCALRRRGNPGGPCRTDSRSHHRRTGPLRQALDCQRRAQPSPRDSRCGTAKHFQSPFAPVHWFWSDQYDVNVQYAGFHRASGQLIVRGALEARDFMAFYLNGGHIDAVVGANRGKDIRRVMPLIKARAIVDPRQLADEDVDLRSLIAGDLSGAHT